jgi:hypothetical protein
MKYFIHDPEDGTHFFDTQLDFEKAMSEFDFMGRYCEDGWSCDVENVIAGCIPDGIKRVEDESSDDWEDDFDFYHKFKTHSAQKINERKRPDNLDEDDLDEDGTNWGEWDYICDYVFLEDKS